MAALVPYVLPAILGGALGSMNARNKNGKGARWGGFLKGALAGAAAGYGAQKLGVNPFSAKGAPVPGGAGGLSFNPMSFFNQQDNRIEPEQMPMQPLLQPEVNYLPPMNY